MERREGGGKRRNPAGERSGRVLARQTPGHRRAQISPCTDHCIRREYDFVAYCRLTNPRLWTPWKHQGEKDYDDIYIKPPSYTGRSVHNLQPSPLLPIFTARPKYPDGRCARKDCNPNTASPETSLRIDGQPSSRTLSFCFFSIPHKMAEDTRTPIRVARGLPIRQPCRSPSRVSLLRPLANHDAGNPPDAYGFCFHPSSSSPRVWLDS